MVQRVAIVSGVGGAGKSATLRSMRQTLSTGVGEVAVLESDHFYMAGSTGRPRLERRAPAG